MKSTQVYTVTVSPFFNDFFYLIQKLIEVIHTILEMLAIYAQFGHTGTPMLQ